MYLVPMPYQTAITVKTTLDRIWKHDYVLPAIQREFVWNPKQICKLFDSLMQGFPVGSFLFWKIEPVTSKNFCFFDSAASIISEIILTARPWARLQMVPSPLCWMDSSD